MNQHQWTARLSVGIREITTQCVVKKNLQLHIDILYIFVTKMNLASLMASMGNKTSPKLNTTKTLKRTNPIYTVSVV
uniref:Uncharacterized protein n=1 Tax=Populus trichocarpa TaxID=3694 RepID=A0A2K1ZQZ5_POPTR